MKKWKTGLLIFLALFLSFLPGILRFGQKGEKYAGYPASAKQTHAGRGTVEGSDYLRRRPAFCLYAEASGRAEGTGRQGHFFCPGAEHSGKGRNSAKNAGEGHLIGNHTFSHRDLTALSEKEAEQEVIRAGNAIYEAAGVYTAFIRPPFGRWPENLDFRMTMVPVLWTLDSRDWELKDASAVAARVLEQAEDGEVILMHDCYETSVEAALQIIDEMQKQGFEFVTVDEMVFS